MKKTLSIILALTLALSLAVTAMAGVALATPTGDNVVKLTCPEVGEDYRGDLYLDFSQLNSTSPADPAVAEDGMEYHIPTGSTVRLSWMYDGLLRSLDDPGTSIHFVYEKAPGDRIFAESAYNVDGSMTVTFTEPGTYEFIPTTPLGGWRLSPKPVIVVEDASASTAGTAAGATTATPTAGASYAVVKGDTLMKIAKKAYGDSKYWSYIYEANSKNLKATNDISVGQVLVIPVIPAAAPAEKPAETPAEKPATTAVPTAGASYTVVKGDNLSKIAKAAYGDANQWKKIYEANKDAIKDPNVIDVGQVLVIPA